MFGNAWKIVCLIAMLAMALPVVHAQYYPPYNPPCSGYNCGHGYCDIAVSDISVSGNFRPGDTEPVTVTIRNDGSLNIQGGYIDLRVPCGYVTYESSSYDPPIGYISVGSSRSFTFYWHTSGCSCGSKNLQVVLTNARCDGSVPCSGPHQQLTRNIYINCQDSCTPGYTDNYRCSGDWRQREYKKSDCTYEWRDYEHCDDDCENGRCVDDHEEEDCDDKDGYRGDSWCEHGKKYRTYRDYYYYHGECKYHEYDKEIGSCHDDCDDDCDWCNHDNCYNNYCDYNNCYYSNLNCDRRDGYVDGLFCKSGNVYQKYRDYRQSGNACIFTTSDVLIETCSGYCSSGRCAESYCSQANCDSRDTWTGAAFCKDGSVYKAYRDYYCSGSGNACAYTQVDRLYQACSNGCSGGVCIQQSCEDQCSEWTACSDCSGGKLKKTCVEQHLSGNRCVSGETYTLYTDTGSPASDYNEDRTSKIYELGSQRVHNGLIFGNNFAHFNLKSDFKPESATLTFKVTYTNSMQPMTITINDEFKVTKYFERGEHTIEIDGSYLHEENTIDIEPVSSGWMLWAPAIYDLEDIKFTVRKD